MMLKSQLGELLMAIAESLDIPQHLYEDAVLKYEDVGGWLASEDSELQNYSPEIYPQGSFRLGTMIKPLTDRDEYDIDLVCCLKIEKENVTQRLLKQMVGDRLRKRKDIAQSLEPGRRCWTLNYRGQFHMDVLPAIPNAERPPVAILLTDMDLVRWQKSSPIAYADWFYDRMKVIFEEKRAALAKTYQVNVEEVPEWQVKTPLQRAVQILKRHRNFHFQNDQDNKPASIIITTLAAKAYRNQDDLCDVLVEMIRDMPRFIERRDGKWSVVNPVDPEENFADKWNENVERARAFFAWLEKLREDFSSAIQAGRLDEAAKALSPTLGSTTIRKAIQALGVISGDLPPVRAASFDSVPALAEASHCREPKWQQRIQYKARVTGTVHRAIKVPKKLWELTDRSVPKGIGLRFKATTNVPGPYQVQWQVVNTGEEARLAGSDELRGGFYTGDGPMGDIRWERTAYAGTHWVEAFIIRDGICVARSGRKHVRIRR